MQSVFTAVWPSVLALGLTACPSVEPPPPSTAAGPSLIALTVTPASLRLEPGSVNLSVRLERRSGPGASVLVSLEGLPDGVSAQTVTIPVGSNLARLTLQVSRSFKLEGPLWATVTAAVDDERVSAALRLTGTDDATAPTDGSDVTVRFSEVTSLEADTSPFRAARAYANFQGSLCQILASSPRRNVEICLTRPFVAGSRYRLVDPQHFGAPGTASVTYFEHRPQTGDQANGVQAAFWDSTDGTLELERASSEALEFRVFGALMRAATDFAKNTATGGFRLEIRGHIEAVSNL